MCSPHGHQLLLPAVRARPPAKSPGIPTPVARRCRQRRSGRCHLATLYRTTHSSTHVKCPRRGARSVAASGASTRSLGTSGWPFRRANGAALPLRVCAGLPKTASFRRAIGESRRYRTARGHEVCSMCPRILVYRFACWRRGSDPTTPRVNFRRAKLQGRFPLPAVTRATLCMESPLRGSSASGCYDRRGHLRDPAHHHRPRRPLGSPPKRARAELGQSSGTLSQAMPTWVGVIKIESPEAICRIPSWRLPRRHHAF